MNHQLPFIQNFRGGFTGILRWPQLTKLWQTLREDTNKHWFVYTLDESPPTQPSNAPQLDKFISEIDTLLRKEHEEDYCGIVYADDRDNPTFIKIYHPNNLGVVCGFSDTPPLPGWVLSLQQPIDLHSALPPASQRRRWWQKLIATAH